MARAIDVEVLPDAATEDVGILRNDGETRSQKMKADLVDVHAVDEDTTSRQGIDPEGRKLREV